MNLVLFGGLGSYAFIHARQAQSESIRSLWRLALLPCCAVVVGGIQRLALQGVRIGWLALGSLDVILGEGQIAQSVLVAAIGVYALIGVRQLALRLSKVESVVGDMANRIKHIPLDTLDLTPRQRAVLRLIGRSTVIDDKTLGESLGVSPDTVHTHVTHLLRKTKLNDRRDLKVFAFVVDAHDERRTKGGAKRLP